MYKTKLRRVGGSVMMTIPPTLLELLRLEAGSTVGVSVEENQIIIDAQPRPRYTLDQLLDSSLSERTDEDQEWLDAPAVGRELL